jgi:hypothetical protein
MRPSWHARKAREHFHPRRCAPRALGIFPEIWAVRKTVYSPEIAEIGNPVYFDREAKAFTDALRNGTPSNVPATQAHNINVVLEALFASSGKDGAEVSLTA